MCSIKSNFDVLHLEHNKPLKHKSGRNVKAEAQIFSKAQKRQAKTLVF